MSNLEKPHAGIRSSRRHLVKMGTIAAYAMFANLSKPKPAAANCGNDKPVGQGKGCEGDPECFSKGTTIRTAGGDKKVEDLITGDLLPTVFGGVCPIQWIGRYPCRKSNPPTAWVKDILPVRIAPSALAPGVPHADLYVTKWHALLIDGILVTAGSLINGTTITPYDVREHDELEFFHIKLARHDVIYAEGAPCETLLNVDAKAVNFAEYLHRYGPPTAKEAQCAPRLSLIGGRNEIKSRFRSAISPWIDCRQKVDMIRDELEERGIALMRHAERMT